MLPDTFAEINQIIHKIYFIHILLNFMHLVALIFTPDWFQFRKNRSVPFLYPWKSDQNTFLPNDSLDIQLYVGDQFFRAS